MAKKMQIDCFNLIYRVLPQPNADLVCRPCTIFTHTLYSCPTVLNMPLRVFCAPNFDPALSEPTPMLTMLAVSFQRLDTKASLELASRDTTLSLRGSMFFISHDSHT